MTKNTEIFFVNVFRKVRSRAADEVDWLWALSLEADTKQPSLETFLDYLQGYGFNHLLVCLYANFSTWNEALPDGVAPKVVTQHTPWTPQPGG